MKSRADMTTNLIAVHDALDAVNATMAPHGDLATAMTNSGYPQDQVQGARLADMVAAFYGLTAAISLLIPTREEIAEHDDDDAARVSRANADAPGDTVTGG